LVGGSSWRSRPDQPRNDERPLDQGIAHVVVTTRDGRTIPIVQLAARE
jgi:hypothetical protein